MAERTAFLDSAKCLRSDCLKRGTPGREQQRQDAGDWVPREQATVEQPAAIARRQENVDQFTLKM
jgi:hypothetical protein